MSDTAVVEENSLLGKSEALRPFVRYFESGGLGFALDPHTNKLFRLDESEAKVFQAWLAGARLADLAAEHPREVRDLLRFREQGLFCGERPEGLAFGLDWNGIKKKILHERERTLLEITQQCNLRCRYCTFGGGFEHHRSHSQLKMSKKLIRDAVSAAIAHGDGLEEIGIGFYGGEPLTAFGLLSEAVRFAQAEARGKRIRFSLTTNGTLLDKTKACFLKDAGFSVLVSLDGPRQKHDLNRVFPDGSGSYSRAIAGLRTLLEVYPPELHSKIGINMVVGSIGELPELETLWDDEPWLPRTLRAQVAPMSVPDTGPLPGCAHVPDPKKPRRDWLASIEEGIPGKTTLNAELYDKSMAKLHKRRVFPGRRRTFFPNGCCIPGTRKVYVQADGVYRICERVHGLPPIGSVSGGVDLQEIKRVIDEYAARSIGDCRDCLGISACRLCFRHAYEGKDFSIEKKRLACATMRGALSAELKTYGLISEKYPHKLEEWDKAEIH